MAIKNDLRKGGGLGEEGLLTPVLGMMVEAGEVTPAVMAAPKKVAVVDLSIAVPINSIPRGLRMKWEWHEEEKTEEWKKC